MSSDSYKRLSNNPRDEDYYLILDVDFNASQETIASAYKKLALKFHPDKNNQDERSRKEAQAIFEKIKAAYDVLGDPRKRQIYDTLGPEGVKLDGWKMVRKQMTAQEIREEYLRLKRQQFEGKIALVAKPRASFTVALDASEFFSRRIEEDDIDEEDLDDDEPTDKSLLSSVPSIEISSLSASMAFDNNPTTNQSVTLSGNVETKNGTGDGSFGATYRYKYSPLSQFDLLCRFGRGPFFTAGVSHQLNDKTSLACQGMLIVLPNGIAPGAKITLAHKIRDYLRGKVSYREGFNSSVTTSLIYLNQKLMLEVTTSYKLGKLGHGASVDLGYRFNNDNSKLSVTLAAVSNEGLAVEYGCQTTILSTNVIGASLSFRLPSGVILKLRLNRANQEFNVPIYLSDELHSAPVFYGTMVPLVAYYLLDRCYLRHYKELR